ncbi:MAG: ABC transporter substrate-binding protein, partial [Actinomycetota bacterium]
MRRRSTNLLAMFSAAVLLFTACAGSDGDDASSATTAESSDDDADTADDEGENDEGAGDEVDGDERDDADGAGDEPVDDTTATTVAPLEDEDQLTSQGEGSQANPDLEPQQGGEITWGLTNDGTGFATTGSIGPGSIYVITSMVDALVGLDNEANWHPNLAESLVPNDDFTEWTITMRPDLVFHDGEPVDAAAVAANLEAFKGGSVGFALAPVATIEAVSDLDVVVTMSSPWAAFPYTLVNQPGWMVSPATIGQNDTFVSTGPFMLESWTPGDGARVVRNPNYWRADEGLPYLDAISFKFLVDTTVKRQAFEAGDVQGYISPADEDIVDFLEDDAVDVWISAAGANEYLWILNTTAAPFDDLRVRRAMAHAIDKDFLIENFRSGLTTPATGPLNPSDKWYSETTYPEFDPAAAQALVDEYEAEVGPIEF